MSVALLDFAVVIICISAAVGGYRLGFVTRAASWVGMALGVLIAIRLVPVLLDRLQDTGASTRLGLMVMLLLTGALLGQIGGLLLGSRLTASLPTKHLRKADQVAGAAAGVVGVLVLTWLFLPFAANVPGWPARQVRNSEIAQQIYNNTPRPPDAVSTLHRLVGDSASLPVFENIEPARDTGPPPASVTLSIDVVERVKASTVKVQGVACRKVQEGSGFAVGPNLIATNAHVVAGEDKTQVLLPNGDTIDTDVVAYDPARDLAILRSSKYRQIPLPIGRGDVGTTGAVFGHPGGQDAIDVQPAQIRREITAVGRDLYNKQQTRREVLELAAQLRQGDSGGPLVDSGGSLVGVAFAIAPDNPEVAYALAPSELRDTLAQVGPGKVDTGACVSG